MPEVIEFPGDFLWGVCGGGPGGEGLSEGSDWRIWERAGKAPVSGQGNGRRDRFEEDFQKMNDLGFGHYRLNLEWARIEPQRGVYNREALEDYRQMLESAKRRGLSVWLGLHRFSLPAWFARMGGFTDATAVVYWHRYVELAAREMGRLADHWIPIDQPMIYALKSQLLGKLPPGKQRMDKFNDMVVAIHRAHGDAVLILRKYLPPRARIGFNLFVAPALPIDPDSDADRMAADFVDNYLHRVSLSLFKDGSANIPGKGVVEAPTCKKAADFIGIDNFLRLLVRKETTAGEAGCLKSLCEMSGMPGIRLAGEGDLPTESGHGGAPEAIYDAIKVVHQAGFELPVYITASGIAASGEKARADYIARCLERVHFAISQGIDVRGYFHYRDVDAYEWDLGYNAHYGLFGFNPESFERVERPAAKFFHDIIKSRKLPAAG